MTFYGEQDYNLDDKGRMLIPKEYRAELGDVVMLMRGVDGQLYVYPKPAFDAMRQRIAQFEDTESFRGTRLAVNTAIGCEVDKQGRILIPARLRGYAGLDDHVVVAGNEDHIEVWNPDEYENTFVRLKSQFRQKPEEFTKMREAGLRL
jgi:MraZ protein